MPSTGFDGPNDVTVPFSVTLTPLEFWLIVTLSGVAEPSILTVVPIKTTDSIRRNSNTSARSSPRRRRGRNFLLPEFCHSRNRSSIPIFIFLWCASKDLTQQPRILGIFKTQSHALADLFLCRRFAGQTELTTVNINHVVRRRWKSKANLWHALHVEFIEKSSTYSKQTV